MKLNSLALLVCGLLAGICVTQEKQAESIAEPEVARVEVLTDLEEALVTANKTKKPVFVYVFDSV